MSWKSGIDLYPTELLYRMLCVYGIDLYLTDCFIKMVL